MIRAHSTGSTLERLARLEMSINRSPVVYPFAVFSSESLSITTSVTNLGGCVVDRAWLQGIAPDAQWVVRAAGWVDPADANGVTVSLVYQKDNVVTVTLGSATYTGAGATKKALGPFDVFATGGVPTGESLACLRASFVKVTSGTATIYAPWTMWLELRAAAQ